MEANSSIQNSSGMETLHCDIVSTLYLLERNEKFYLSFTIIVQTVLTMIINALVLVAIKNTKQRKNKSLGTTRLLWIHDIVAALLGRLAILVFLNQEIKNCNIARFLSSVWNYRSATSWDFIINKVISHWPQPFHFQFYGSFKQMQKDVPHFHLV